MANSGSVWLAIVSGIAGAIGLIVNVGVDTDNIYDMTTITMFVIAIILAWVAAAAFYHGTPSQRYMERETERPQQH